MGQSPFAKNSAFVSPSGSRRRSTRVEFIVPIIISGRDASGQPFREETETILVNAHGASFRMRCSVLVGMQLTVENRLSGLSDKAICVRVADCEPGQDRHVVAIQLLIPQNIWGVKDPPADWQHPIQSGQPSPQTTSAAPPTGESASAAVAPNAALEQKSSDLTESLLQALRQQVAGMLQESLKEFESSLKALEAGAEARMVHCAEKTHTDAQASLEDLQGDFIVQLSLQSEQSLAAAEESLREKLAEMFAPRPKDSPDARPMKKNDPAPKP